MKVQLQFALSAAQYEFCRQKTEANKFNFNQKYHGRPVVAGAREGSWRVVCCVPLGKGIFTLKPQSRERRKGRRVERGRLAPHLPFHVTGNKLTLIETMLKAQTRSARPVATAKLYRERGKGCGHFPKSTVWVKPRIKPSCADHFQLSTKFLKFWEVKMPKDNTAKQMLE